MSYTNNMRSASNEDTVSRACAHRFGTPLRRYMSADSCFAMPNSSSGKTSTKSCAGIQESTHTVPYVSFLALVNNVIFLQLHGCTSITNLNPSELAPLCPLECVQRAACIFVARADIRKRSKWWTRSLGV